MWQGVLFKIQPREAINQKPRKNIFLAAFQTELF